MSLWSAADKIPFRDGVWVAVLVYGHVRQELELAARALAIHRFKHPDGACEVRWPPGPVRSQRQVDHAGFGVASLGGHAEQLASAREIARNAVSLEIPEGELHQAVRVAARFKQANAFDSPASLRCEPCIFQYAHSRGLARGRRHWKPPEDAACRYEVELIEGAAAQARAVAAVDAVAALYISSCDGNEFN